MQLTVVPTALQHFLSTHNGAQSGTGGGLSLLAIMSGGHPDLSWVEPVGCQVSNVSPVGPVRRVVLK